MGVKPSDRSRVRNPTEFVGNFIIPLAKLRNLPVIPDNGIQERIFPVVLNDHGRKFSMVQCGSCSKVVAGSVRRPSFSVEPPVAFQCSFTGSRLSLCLGAEPMEMAGVDAVAMPPAPLTSCVATDDPGLDALVAGTAVGVTD